MNLDDVRQENLRLRNEIIYRLEKLINNHKEFYERHPELLQQVKDKIQLLKDGYDYKIRNANWVIPYTWGSSVGLQKIDRDGKIILQDVEKIKNEMTVDKAKEVLDEIMFIIEEGTQVDE